MNKSFFHEDLQTVDPQIYALLQKELKRQSESIELIASENLVSYASMQALSNISTNKYAEGYPGQRYYGGCEYVDEIEAIAIERAKKLFDCAFVNVQPHSGASANQAVFMALMHPGDTYLGMGLDSGGHLTHGAPVNQSGKWFNAISYGLDNQGYIDISQVETLAKKYQPKLIIAGGSAYSRVIDFAAFRCIADNIGAYLMVDMAHFAGLVAGGVYPSPVPYAHVITTTTHKTLRCGRGGLIISNDVNLGKKFNSAVFPGLQGGPLLVSITSKAVGFKEALNPEFKIYCQSVVQNARALGETLVAGGVNIISGGTDSHLLLVDLRRKNITGRAAAITLERAGMTCNKNSIPNDLEKPMVTSGIRLGSPAGTTRGMSVSDFRQIGKYIITVLDGLAQNGTNGNAATEKLVLDKIKHLCHLYPIYSSPIGHIN